MLSCTLFQQPMKIQMYLSRMPKVCAVYEINKNTRKIPRGLKCQILTLYGTGRQKICADKGKDDLTKSLRRWGDKLVKNSLFFY